MTFAPATSRSEANAAQPILGRPQATNSPRTIKESDMTTQSAPFTAGGLEGDALWRELERWLGRTLAHGAALYAAGDEADRDELDAHTDDLEVLHFAFSFTPAKTRFARRVKARAAKFGFGRTD